MTEKKNPDTNVAPDDTKAPEPATVRTTPVELQPATPTFEHRSPRRGDDVVDEARRAETTADNEAVTPEHLAAVEAGLERSQEERLKEGQARVQAERDRVAEEDAQGPVRPTPKDEGDDAA